MFLDSSVITLKAARSVHVGGQLGELYRMAHLRALRGVDEVALLLLDFGRGRDQEEETVYSVESGQETLWFREIAFD